jgi:hypothetical protein
MTSSDEAHSVRPLKYINDLLLGEIAPLAPMTSQGSDNSELLERLYPVPLSTGVVGLPGPTAASSQALLTALLHNRENNHIFFNDKGFHKYVAFRDVHDLVPRLIKYSCFN